MPGCCCTNRHRPSPYAPHLADRGLLQNAPIFYLLRQSNPPLPDNSPESTVPILHLRDISERTYVEVIVSLVDVRTRVLQRNQCRGPYHKKQATILTRPSIVASSTSYRIKIKCGRSSRRIRWSRHLRHLARRRGRSRLRFFFGIALSRLRLLLLLLRYGPLRFPIRHSHHNARREGKEEEETEKGIWTTHG